MPTSERPRTSRGRNPGSFDQGRSYTQTSLTTLVSHGKESLLQNIDLGLRSRFSNTRNTCHPRRSATIVV